jgi:hypothetical protein
MKNRLTLSLLFSLFTGIAMHASDAYKQQIKNAIKQNWPEAEYIMPVYSEICLTDIHIFFNKKAGNLPLCMTKPVFTYKNINYMLSSIELNVSLKCDKKVVSGLTHLTLAPVRQ